jgi:hypothetical protein
MALILYSCSLGDQSIPKGIIKINPMADILLDIAVAESYTESYILKDSTLNKDSVYKSEISKVLQLHNTDPSGFSRSYSFYADHPTLFKIVVDSTHDRAVRKKQRVYSNAKSHFK